MGMKLMTKIVCIVLHSHALNVHIVELELWKIFETKKKCDPNTCKKRWKVLTDSV